MSSMTNKDFDNQTTQNTTDSKGEALQPCRFCGKEANGFWNGPYLHISGPPDGLHFYSIVCNGCCSTASYESKERAVEKWNAPRASLPAVEGEALRGLLDQFLLDKYGCTVEHHRMKVLKHFVEWVETTAVSSSLPAELRTHDPQDAERERAFREMWAEDEKARPFDPNHPENYATFTKRYATTAAPAEPLQPTGEQELKSCRE